jgi:hypothetical protein
VVDSVAQADCLHRLSACPQTGGHGAPTNASQGDIS